MGQAHIYTDDSMTQGGGIALVNNIQGKYLIFETGPGLSSFVLETGAFDLVLGDLDGRTATGNTQLFFFHIHISQFER